MLTSMHKKPSLPGTAWLSPTGSVATPSRAAMIMRQSASTCACGGSCPRCQAQSSLKIGAPDDHYEREADRVADSVMSGRQNDPVHAISPGMHLKLSRKVLEPDEVLDSVLPAEGTSSSEQPEVAEPENLQRSATAEADAVTPQYERTLQQAVHSGGEHLPTATRAFMESRFGRDFSAVRLHRDEQASGLAQQVNARAFTVGSDIFLPSPSINRLRMQGSACSLMSLPMWCSNPTAVCRDRSCDLRAPLAAAIPDTMRRLTGVPTIVPAWRYAPIDLPRHRLPYIPKWRRISSTRFARWAIARPVK